MVHTMYNLHYNCLGCSMHVVSRWYPVSHMFLNHTVPWPENLAKFLCKTLGSFSLLLRRCDILPLFELNLQFHSCVVEGLSIKTKRETDPQGIPVSVVSHWVVSHWLIWPRAILSSVSSLQQKQHSTSLATKEDIAQVNARIDKVCQVLGLISFTHFFQHTVGEDHRCNVATSFQGEERSSCPSWCNQTVHQRWVCKTQWWQVTLELNLTCCFPQAFRNHKFGVVWVFIGFHFPIWVSSGAKWKRVGSYKVRVKGELVFFGLLGV